MSLLDRIRYAFARQVKCECRIMEKFAADPSVPIVFDERLNELKIQTRDGGEIDMFFCFACGGALPDSKKGDFFHVISAIELAEAEKAKEQIQTVSEMKRILGEPDWTHDVVPQDPVKAKVYGAQDFVRQYTYLKRWPTVALFVHERPTGKLVFTITANWKEHTKSTA